MSDTTYTAYEREMLLDYEALLQGDGSSKRVSQNYFRGNTIQNEKMAISMFKYVVVKHFCNTCG